MRFCSRCGRSLARRDRFCGACGTASPEVLRETRALEDAEHARVRRAGAAMAIVFVGVLTALLAIGAAEPRSPVVSTVLLSLAEVGVGLAAVLRLGWRSLRATLGRWPALRHLVWALPTAAASATVAVGYVALLRALFAGELDVDPDVAPVVAPVAAVVLGILLVPVCEEWLCRGVLWIAVRPVASPTVTLVVSAVLFALLHGLNGGYLLEVPHRLVAGLLFGWLRVRSGSLLPSVVAHGLHNAAAFAVSW